MQTAPLKEMAKISIKYFLCSPGALLYLNVQYKQLQIKIRVACSHIIDKLEGNSSCSHIYAFTIVSLQLRRW